MSRYQLLRAIIEIFTIRANTDGYKFYCTESYVDAYEKLSGNILTAEKLKNINTERWKDREIARKRESRLDHQHEIYRQMRMEHNKAERFRKAS